MNAGRVVELVSFGLAHDADRALRDVRQAMAPDDDTALAAAVFLLVLTCRFDEALDAAQLLRGTASTDDRLVRAATDLALAVCAAEIPIGIAGTPLDGELAGLVGLLEIEAAMSAGQISVAEGVAREVSGRGAMDTPFAVWAAIGLVRAWSFAGRFDEAAALMARVLEAPRLVEWPQLLLLARGARVFVDGHRGLVDQVDSGLQDLELDPPAPVGRDYIRGGALVLAAFGAAAAGRLSEAAALILRGGGGDHLAAVQIVDRLYGYEILLEDALARADSDAALRWSELAASLPIGDHQMAAAALGRIRARVAVSLQDVDAAVRESADSGAFAALVGGDLEVMRARILEASARAAGGEHIRGIEELEESARQAGAIGAASVKAWASRELRRHGHRLRNAPGIGWETLSPTQQGVARLAAAGLRNKEIAAALWISEKTVETHVAAVLVGLGASNRVGIGREISGGSIDPMFGAGLTDRQREVALLVARGHSNSDIAAALGISDRTVEKHVSDLFDRLRVRTRGAIAARVRGVQVAVDEPPSTTTSISPG